MGNETKTINNICKEHSGFKARIKECEDNISKLWKKWDNNQKLLFFILGGIILNLIIEVWK